MNEISQRLEHIASQAISRRLSSFLDPVVRRVLLTGFRQACADEGTLWLANSNRTELVPALNSGRDEPTFLRDVRQPLDRGVISMVFHSGQPFCENDMAANDSHDRSIDAALDQVTAAMIAVPFFFANWPRGVVSCVRLGQGQFDAVHLAEIQHCVAVVERLIDGQLLQNLLDLTES